MDPNQKRQTDPLQNQAQPVDNSKDENQDDAVMDPRFEQNSHSDAKDSGIDLYREEHGDLTNDNT